MTMADIWLTAAARAALEKLPSVQAEAVHSAIDDINAAPGQRIDLPGAPPAEPFLAKEPRHPDAPAVIYRRTTTGEPGHWLVVSLMSRADYRAALRAEQELTTYPPAVREFVNAVVAGTVATVTSTAPPGNVTRNPPQTGGAASTTSQIPPTAARRDPATSLTERPPGARTGRSRRASAFPSDNPPSVNPPSWREPGSRSSSGSSRDEPGEWERGTERMAPGRGPALERREPRGRVREPAPIREPAKERSRRDNPPQEDQPSETGPADSPSD